MNRTEIEDIVFLGATCIVVYIAVSNISLHYIELVSPWHKRLLAMREDVHSHYPKHKEGTDPSTMM